jgi:TPR repeat protein
MLAEPQNKNPYDEVKALLRSDPVAAVLRLRTQAQQGDAQAQLAFGQLLINGVGIKLDSREALRWFHAAAESGVPMAMNMIGRCHEYGFGTIVDYGQAARWYLLAADAGCDWAIYNYAHLLANGRGVDRDRAAAFTWFQLATSRGHARAMNFVGLYHENGWETPMDGQAAFMWYRRSAEGGDYRGQCSYASVLAELGHVDDALHWLRVAITTATPRYLEQLAVVLAKSPHESLQDLAKTLCEETGAKKRPASRSQYSWAGLPVELSLSAQRSQTACGIALDSTLIGNV